ncbi:PCRF domain-containing protein [Patescibacteria group bacterium]
MAEKEQKEARIKEIEAAMQGADFWSDSGKAQLMIKEMQELKDELEGVGKYDKGGATLSILAGAGGDDAEDFARMLFDMYVKFIENKGWEAALLHKNENEHNGYRNITIEIKGKNVYGTLKNESGVHRLVRLSPFNTKSQRHTSFALVEIVPKIEKIGEVKMNPDDLKIEFSKSSGPGGQNVNKRETAVRVVHIPTNISVHVDGERTQERNRETALEMIAGKLYHKEVEDRKRELAGLSVSKTTEIEWGNQIRSYVLHPYKMVKDHRTGVETSQVDKVLEDGELDEFIEAEKSI